MVTSVAVISVVASDLSIGLKKRVLMGSMGFGVLGVAWMTRDAKIVLAGKTRICSLSTHSSALIAKIAISVSWVSFYSH